MTIDYSKLTSEILAGINEKTENSLYKNFLTPSVGSVIIGRFIPNMKNPRCSKYHYFHHGWKTQKGSYVTFLCPSTYGEHCPICKKSIQMWKSGDSFQMEASKKIRRKENWVANFYVIDDNNNKKNNESVKLFRFGKQINDKLTEALEGLDKDILGPDIFRLDEKGFNFRIRVTENSENKSKKFNTYAASQFITSRGPIDGVGVEEISKILSATYDLEALYPKVGFNDLESALQSYLQDVYGEPTAIEKPELPSRSHAPVAPVAPAEAPKVQQEKVATPSPEKQPEDELDALLKEIGTGGASSDTSTDEIPF